MAALPKGSKVMGNLEDTAVLQLHGPSNLQSGDTGTANLLGED